jgi:hypothetical protein
MRVAVLDDYHRVFGADPAIQRLRRRVPVDVYTEKLPLERLRGHLHRIGHPGFSRAAGRLDEDVRRHSKERDDFLWTAARAGCHRRAMRVVEQADILLTIGTSLQVYPVAGAVPMAKADWYSRGDPERRTDPV